MATTVWKDIAQALKQLDDLYATSEVDEKKQQENSLNIVGILHTAVEQSQYHTTLLSLFKSSKGLGSMCVSMLKEKSVFYILERGDLYLEVFGLLESMVLNSSMRPYLLYPLKRERAMDITCTSMLTSLADHLILYKKVRWHVDPSLKSRAKTIPAERTPETSEISVSPKKDIVETILRVEIALNGHESLQFQSAMMYSLRQLKHSTPHDP